ncbi:MAG: aminopeptidase [Clostridia bacterium]|nr:aminopeptidase [Clostridia bacterium]
MENISAKELSEKLFYKKLRADEKFDASDLESADAYAKDYAVYLDSSKTEREAVEYTVDMLTAYGFKPYVLGMDVYPGDRLYVVNRNKSLVAFVIGPEGVSNGFRILAAHIDSPRLDLKQHPIYEDNGVCYAKTHYYGGIRKYQWATIRLALHGVVTLKGGKNINVVIGEDDADPVFVITDLLPHLAKDHNAKTLAQAFSGEGLNVVLCASPFTEDGKAAEVDDKVKLNLLNELYKRYGITESDLISAELCFVPAGKTVDVGLDRTLIGGYGHDDKVCAYTELTAMIENLDGSNSLMCVFADKEETGSDGPTGMQGRLMIDIIDEVSRSLGCDPVIVRAKSKCLSADVAAAFDPSYPDVYEKENSALLSCGVAVAKYTGSGGKYSTNDCPAEFMEEIRTLLDEGGVLWQTTELGKVDAGGGGTVAKYISRYNIDTLDIGVPVLSMHAPFEVVSKYDVYSAHRAFSEFCKG